tara:strand:+ start:571 stop:837 length:267 start_codon:yes stop_codon:yes gene_type:complete
MNKNKISNKRNKKRIKRKKNNKKIASIKETARKKLAAIERAIQSFPEVCSACDKEFISSERNIDSWLVSTIEDQIKLFCEDCKPDVST